MNTLLVLHSFLELFHSAHQGKGKTKEQWNHRSLPLIISCHPVVMRKHSSLHSGNFGDKCVQSRAPSNLCKGTMTGASEPADSSDWKSETDQWRNRGFRLARPEAVDNGRARVGRVGRARRGGEGRMECVP